MGNRHFSRKKQVGYEETHRSLTQEAPEEQQGEHEAVQISAVGKLSLSCSDPPSSQPYIDSTREPITAPETPQPRRVDKKIQQQGVRVLPSSLERETRTEFQGSPIANDRDDTLPSLEVNKKDTSDPTKEYTLPQRKIKAGYRCAAESHLGLVHVPHVYTETVCIEALETQLHPIIQPNEVLITPVVSIHPQGLLTFDQPAIIELTKSIELTTQILTKQLVPLHSSDNPLEWKELESHQCEMLDDRVVFNTNRFGYVCVIARFNPISKTIKINPGLDKSEHITVEMKEYPKLKLNFPRQSVRDSTNLTVSVSFGDSYSERNICQNKHKQSVDQHAQGRLTASSVIELKYQNANIAETGTVSVTLPIPHYAEIKREYPDIELQLWTSKSTGDRDSTEYSQVADESTIAIHHDSNGNTSATANVTRFERLKFTWSKAIKKIGTFFTRSVRCRCLVFMSDEERMESYLRFNVAVFLYQYGDAYRDIPNHPHLLFDSKAPIEVSAGSVEYLIVPDDDLLPDILDNSQPRELFSASSHCPGNERKDMSVKLFTDDTHLPKRQFARLVIKHGWKKSSSHEVALIKPSDSRCINPDARLSHPFNDGAKRLRNVMKTLKHDISITEYAAAIAEHMVQVAEMACSTPAYTDRDEAIIEKLNLIVGESSKIKQVSEEVAELCCQEALKKAITDIATKKLPGFEGRHKVLSKLVLDTRHRRYSQIDSDNSIEMLTTNANNLVECITDLMVATDRALVAVPYTKVQELTRNSGAAILRKNSPANLTSSCVQPRPLKKNSDTILTIDDLATVREEFGEECSKWYDIGLQLGLRAGTLDSIQGTAGHCLTSILSKWLRSGLKPSWSSLANALRAKSVGLGQLADQICSDSGRDRKYTL